MKEILDLYWRPLAMLLMVLVCFTVVSAPATTMAQEAAVEEAAPAGEADTPAADDEEENTEDDAAPAATEAITAEFMVNNLWIMIAGMLVFIMHLGFATLESGLTRSKNTVNILFKNSMIVCIGIITYGICGFNLMYPGYDEGTEGADGCNDLQRQRNGCSRRRRFRILVEWPCRCCGRLVDNLPITLATQNTLTSSSKRCLRRLAARSFQVRLLVVSNYLPF